MRKQMAVTAALASALLITGCANTGGMSDTTRRTATGAGVGALGGAAIGAIAGGHAGKGALILGLFGTGAALPLVIVAYVSRSGFAKAKGWVMTRVDMVKKGLGVLIGLTGLVLLLAQDGVRVPLTIACAAYLVWLAVLQWRGAGAGREAPMPSARAASWACAPCSTCSAR